MMIPDGNDEIRDELPLIVDILARTSRWVNPETFRRLPVWCPYVARGQAAFNSAWTTQYQNKKRATGETSKKTEANIAAGKALVDALGVSRPKPKNWTVCHIWGYDDPAFAVEGSIVRDPRYYSCVANMVWLPTPLKGFTDALPEVKAMLRTCAFYLYGWVCEHETVKEQAETIRAGAIPEGYPESWPAPDRKDLMPAGTAPFTTDIEARVNRQKEKIKGMLADESLTNFPHQATREVLKFWNVLL